MRAMAPAVASAAVAVRLLGALASLALLTSFVAATRAEDAAPATPDLPIPKAEALLGIDLDYDHVTKYFDNDKVTRTGVWDLKYGLDEGGGSLTRWASSGSTNTKDAGLDVDHEVKTRCDRRRDLEIWVTLGEDDARFSATALAQKGGKSFVSIFAGDHDVFDAKSQRRELTWSLDSGDITFKYTVDILLKHGQVALCPKPVAAAAIGSGCTVFSLKGFPAAYDYVCDAKEAR